MSGPDEAATEAPGRATGESAPDGDRGEYLAHVLGEIDAEVRRRRRQIPVAKERELDALFLQHAPMGSRYGDIEVALRMVDSSAFIDPVVPVASRLPAGAAVKKGMRTLSLWYVGYITHQVSQFAAAVSRTLHLVDNHLDELRRMLPPAIAVPVVDAGAPGAWWTAPVLGAVAGADGRVLHAACGDGWLVAALKARGVDAYGVDPRPGATASAELDGADLREEPVLDHLRAAGDASLGAVVLSGVVDGMGARDRGELLQLLGDRLTERAVLAVHSLRPAAWAADDAPFEADLAPGRPLRPETWRHVLEGWSVAVHAGPDERDYLVVASR